MSQLHDSYKLCAKICTDSGSSFTVAFRQLAPRERKAMEAVYAFMRLADDLVDSSHPHQERAQSLETFRNDFLRTEQNPDGDSVFPAVWDVIRNFSIPKRFFLEVLRGIQMDLECRFYETREDLEAYCYHVASAVGLICLYIWGVSPEKIQPETDSEVFRAAVACGKALQWTNILRDVLEDARAERIYLPLEDWPSETGDSSQTNSESKFEWIKKQILAGNVSTFNQVLEKNLATAYEFYVQARLLRRWIPAPNRRIFDLMTGVYFTIWRKIRRHPMKVFQKKIRLNTLEKLKVYFFTFFQ